jgi:hypothetical protein
LLIFFAGGGRPAEVRHVPDNKGVGCRGGDNVALDALPTVPPTVPRYRRPIVVALLVVLLMLLAVPFLAQFF